MLGLVENTWAGMPTSSGFAPSSTRTATRRSREAVTGFRICQHGAAMDAGLGNSDAGLGNSDARLGDWMRVRSR
jgi:hypothetical protein